MAVGKITAIIEMDASDFHAEVKRAGIAVTRFAGQVDNTGSSIRRIEKHLTGFGAALRHSLVNLALARTAMHNVWLATGAWQKKIVDTAGDLERMQFLLKGMSKATSEQEKLNDAMKDFNFIIGMAKNAPFTVSELANTFVKFRSVGLDPTNGSMQALIDGVARFGGSDEVLHRASVAIQQMAGKGVISMEELRQQLGEAVPQAIQLMARGMGLSMKDLIEKVSTGTVEARTALGKMFTEFQRSFGGAAERMMDSYTGKISRLKTSWILFAQQVANASPLMENIKKRLDEVTLAMDPERAARFAKTLGTALSNLMDIIASTIEWVVRYRRELYALIQVLGPTIIAFKAWSLAASVMPALMAGVGASVSKFVASMMMANRSAQLFSFALYSMRTAIAAIWASLKVFSAWLLTTPMGLAVLAAALVAGAMLWIKYGSAIGKANSAMEQFQKYGYATAEDIVAMRAGLTALKDDLAKKQKLLEDHKKYLTDRGLLDPQGNVKPGDARSSEDTRRIRLYQSYVKQVEESNRAVETMTREHNAALLDLGQENITKSEMAARRGVQSRIDAIKDGFRKERDAIYEQQQKLSTGDTTGRDALQKKLADVTKREGEALLTELSTNIAAKEARIATLKKTADAASKNEIRDLETQIRTLDRMRSEFREQAAAGVASDLTTPVFLDPKKISDSQSAINSYYQTLVGKIADMKAEIAGGNDDYAKFLAQLEAGKFSESGKNATLDEIKALLQLLPELEDKLKQVRQESANYSDAQELVTRWSASAAEETEQLADALANGGFDLADSRVRQFDKAMAALQATISPEKFALLADKVREIRRALSENAGQKTMIDLKKDERDLIQSLARTRLQAHQEEMAQYEKRIQAEIAVNDVLGNRGDIILQMQSNMALMQEKFLQESPMGAMALEWINATEAMQEATASWLDQSVEAMVTFAETGKFAVKDLAKSILKDILRIILHAMIAKAVMSAIGLVGGGTMNGQGFGLSQSQLNGAYTDIGGLGFAMGGIMDGYGSRRLKRYARGGIADRAQVAVFGEGDQPEAYVPLPDGRTIPVTLKGAGAGASQANVEINVINQSGTPVAAEQRGQRFDGQKMILDVVLTAMTQPGSFRDGMRGSVR